MRNLKIIKPKILLMLAAVLLAIAACSSREKAAITDACMLSAPAGSVRTEVAQKCECFAGVAEKYLAKEDYILFANVMKIYISGDEQGVKADRVMTELIRSGVGGSRALQLFLSFGLIVERQGKECGV